MAEFNRIVTTVPGVHSGLTEELYVWFCRGDKELGLKVDLSEGRAETYLAYSYPFKAGDKQPGDTTCLYLEARRAMEQLASELGRPINYTFATVNPHLRSWVLDQGKGKGVFEWDQVGEDQNGKLVAKKKIIAVS